MHYLSNSYVRQGKIPFVIIVRKEGILGLYYFGFSKINLTENII